MKLYKIKDDLVQTLDVLLEVEEDELAKENCIEMLEFLKEELKNKSDSILKYLRNLTLEKESVESELERLEKLKKSKDKKIKRLKDYMINIMIQLNEKKIETDIGSYGLRRSTKVDIIDEKLIPEDFIKIKTERNLDKIGIANYIKQYGEMAGARIVESYSLQIK
ncbi:siphovirus Gp157 family protein [Fusobacterium russii]|uniref:siphovirus Gp157 family protein n=1 Tax=Fusobacterium russii TaxID=854 RepID=UPI00039F7DEC|nr:siphovirus Gp157 family protein [Fusobacterium russii]